MPVQNGDVLAGKYEIVSVIGHGGMGIVYEAQHQRLGQRVAVKVLQAEVSFVREAVQRFEREARAAAKLTSPFVARVRDVDNLSDGRPFMVMEYLEGNDLDEELGRRGQLEVQEAVDYVLQTCMGMIEAHHLGIVHRDLKPHNLFLTQRDGKPCVKVLDFGVSKLIEDSAKDVTVTATSLGTPQYMSPEQIRSAKHVDRRSDIWQLGIILYELLTGQTPFQGDSPTAVVAAITADAPVPLQRVRPELPAQLCAIVMKTIEKSPDRRFQTVRAMGDLLAPFGSPGLWQPPDLPSEPGLAPEPRPSAPSFEGTFQTEPSFDGEQSAPSFVDAPTQRLAANTAATWSSEGRKARIGRRTQVALASGAILVLGAAVFFGLRGAGSSDPAGSVVPGSSATGTPATTESPTRAEAPPEPTADEGSTTQPESTADAAAPTATSTEPPAPRPRPRPRPTATTPPKPKPRPTAPTPTAPPIHL